MNQNFNYNKEVCAKNFQAYRYREFWIDPNLGRPWTFLEERMMKKFVENPDTSILMAFVGSKTFQACWPEFLAKKTIKPLVKAGYLKMDSDYYFDQYAYRLTNYGQCMFSKKRAYEM